MRWEVVGARSACSLVERFFAGELARDGWEQLLRHLDICDACRARFATTRQAFRELGRLGAGNHPSQGQLGRIDGELIGEVLLRPARPRRSFRQGAALLACAASVALIAIVTTGRHPRQAPVFSERGGAAAARPGFDVLCLGTDEAASVISARHAGGRCARDSYLKLTITDAARTARFAAVVAVDRDWRLRFVTRAEISGQSAQILPGHAQLSSDDHLYFKALFSAEQVDDAGIARAIARARAANAGPAAPLPISGEQLTYEVQTDE